MKIAIAGSFGFIGQHVIREVLDCTRHEIVALSRSPRESEGDRIQCVTADLYSLKESTEALKGCDAALYLVHSMAPSSRLSQGNFKDFDFILADNFARAAQTNGIKQIVYVGGMIPECEELSAHLGSRLEVENVLKSHGVPVTTLRCGLVIGTNGSSFSIIVRLAERLPVMILPQWMRTLSNPIYADDLAKIIVKCLDNPVENHRTFDAGMDQAVSYKDIVIETAKILDKSPQLIDVPYVSPHLSKLWVRLVSGAPKALVYPLIDSVRHEMLKSPTRHFPAQWNIEVRSLSEAIRATFEKPFYFNMPRMLTSIRDLSEVRSVQRLPLPRNWNAEMVANAYTRWLPSFLKPFLRVSPIENGCEYRLRFLPIVLLTLNRDSKISGLHRQLFRVGNGVLVALKNKGRFEFRESHDSAFIIVALHNYRPSLPWNIYRWSQAVIHRIVMHQFAKHLKRI